MQAGRHDQQRLQSAFSCCLYSLVYSLAAAGQSEGLHHTNARTNKQGNGLSEGLHATIVKDFETTYTYHVVAHKKAGCIKALRLDVAT